MVVEEAKVREVLEGGGMKVQLKNREEEGDWGRQEEQGG